MTIAEIEAACDSDQWVLSPKDVARHFMRQVPFGPSRSRAVRFAAIENLLTAEIFELRYTDLDWAIDRLRALVREGR